MHGGRREGAGRKAGSKSKRTVEREQKIEQVARVLDETLPNAFRGDAHALLMTVYKDETHPLPLRLDAAKAAIGYEKPRLQSVDATVDLRKEVVDLSDAELAAIAAGRGSGATQETSSPSEPDPLH